jgi:hypothetical protein
LWAQALTISLNSMPFPQHDHLAHECLFYSLVFEHAKEYSWATYDLAPFSFTPMSSYTTLVFITLHPESYGYFLLS